MSTSTKTPHRAKTPDCIGAVGTIVIAFTTRQRVRSNPKTSACKDLHFPSTHKNTIGGTVFISSFFVNLVGQVADQAALAGVIDRVAGFVGYRHFWNEKWRSTGDVSVYFGDNPSSLPGSVNDNAQSISVNLLYSPDPMLTLGVEYMNARRELKSGADGQFDRIQFSARYDFGYQSTN